VKKAVITGIGVVSPIGNSTEEFWENAKAGKSGGGTLDRFDPEKFSSKIAAQVKDFDPQNYMDKKEARRADLIQQFALAAAEMAIVDSGLDAEKQDKSRVAVITGSGIGGISTFEKYHALYLKRGPSKVSPFFIPMMIIDMIPGLISIRYGFTGPNYATVSACASSAHAIADAMRLVERGDVDMVVTGGAEASVTEMAFAGFCSSRALSTRNDDPATASRPFDKDRDGFVIGEGAAILIVEEEQHALKRGARIYADLLGVGMTADAYHMTAPAPDGSGSGRAMTTAVADAGLELTDVDYINTHGTSTPLGDVAESMAIRKVFGAHADSLVTNSTKSMTGHMLGGAGAIETATTALSLLHGYVHRTINVFNQDPECDLDYVTEGGRELPIKVGLTNSFGFGGHNITLALGKHQNSDPA
jgi:3-oxoacyl-[acyl-carrier-protein] synthase II